MRTLTKTLPSTPPEKASTTDCPLRVKVTFVERDGKERRVEATVGQDLLTLAHGNDIDLEGAPVPDAPVTVSPGACEGSLACSTCHVIVEV